ncbi:transposase [Hymenobacter antarcticus]|uniref:Transposase IS116/IS110/IS902 C-terminal domain-containing protein n=1 Tax=Hymenobacter antarcticus TaxID=486270 RepID=A0ABP7NYA6_9BACT
MLTTEILLTTNAFRDRTDSRCYASVVLFARSSGRHRGQSRVSDYANKRVKALLHLAMLPAVRWCKPLKAYYERKVAEGKNKMLVLNNVCNKPVLAAVTRSALHCGQHPHSSFSAASKPRAQHHRLLILALLAAAGAE